MKIKSLITICLSAYIVFTQLSASALSVDKSYQYDENKQSISAPCPYTVDEVLYGDSFGTIGFNNAADLCVDKNQNLYIADSGNNRVLIIDKNKNLIKIITSVNVKDGATELSNPMGVFKAKDGYLYVCDTGNGRVIALDNDNNVIRNIKGESMVSVNQNLTFSPEKVVVDADQNVFVVSSSVYQGIIRFNKDGDFQSFFAPNEVKTTVNVLMLSLWKKIFNSEQSEMISKSLPASYNNIIIDDEGFIYATSTDANEGLELKKLNAVGSNILKTAGKSGKIYGDYDIVIRDKKAVDNSFIDVQVDEDEVISMVDGNSNKIFQYDNEGNLITIFGGIGFQKGKFKNISSIEKWNGQYIVLDRDKNSLTVFNSTPYIDEVRNSLTSYHNGLYVESEKSWKNILTKNSNFLIAYRSIGRAELQQGNYKSAMKALKKGDDKYFYSLTLKEYRKQFIRNNFIVLIAATVLSICFIVFIIKFIKKKLME